MTINFEPIQGSWQAIEAKLGGKAVANEIVDATTLTIAGETYEVDLAGTTDSGLCEVNASTSPIQLTIKGIDGPNEGRTFLAIVEIMSDSNMRIAYDLTGSDFPTSFTPSTITTNYVAIFSRLP